MVWMYVVRLDAAAVRLDAVVHLDVAARPDDSVRLDAVVCCHHYVQHYSYYYYNFCFVSITLLTVICFYRLSFVVSDLQP